MYQIHEYRQFPAPYIAILSKGLNSDSRIKKQYSGIDVSEDMLIKSLIYDRLSLLVWFQSEDGAKGRNKPVSLYEHFTNQTNSKNKQISGFETSEDFELKRKLILQSIEKGGG